MEADETESSDEDDEAKTGSAHGSPAADVEVEEDEEDGEEVDDEEDLLLDDDDEEEAAEQEEFSLKEIGFEDMMKYGFAQKEAFGSIKCSSAEFGNAASGHA